MLTKDWARQSISEGRSNVTWLYPDGSTKDIISAIGYADERSAPFTERFSEALKGMSKFDAARNIWYFLKNNIRYVEDSDSYGKGFQFVKSPAQLVTDGTGDCKSLSVFTGSVLQNLGIPYQYKFTAYHDPADPDNRNVKHVYVIVPDGKRNIIIDAVYNRFNAEKLPIKVQTVLTPTRYMARIAYIEGIEGKKAKIGCGCNNNSVGKVSAGVKDALTHFAVSALFIGGALIGSNKS